MAATCTCSEAAFLARTSLLNAGRAGIEGNRSSLFRELCRLAADVQRLCRMAGLDSCRFAECVLMSATDEAAVTRELCWPLVLTCPSGAALNRRPRSFWVSRLPKSGPGIAIDAEGSHHRMTFFGEVEEPSMWVTPGWKFLGESEAGIRLPTLTSAIPRGRPAWKAPGLERVDAETFSRYAADGYRFPPYTYERRYCVAPVDCETGQVDMSRARVCRAVEREILLGLRPHHTRAILGRAAQTRQVTYYDDSERCAALGNTFHTLSTAALVGVMLHDLGFEEARASPMELQARLQADVADADRERPRDSKSHEIKSALQIEPGASRSFSAPGVMSVGEIEEHASFAAEQGRRLDLDREFTAEVALGADAPERRLVTHYLRRMDARGSEVKLDLGLSFRLRPTHRASVQTTRWVWRHVLGSQGAEEGAHSPTGVGSG